MLVQILPTKLNKFMAKVLCKSIKLLTLCWYLGPLLFILYINDVVNVSVSKDAELLFFADNVFLYDTDIPTIGPCK